MHQSYLLKLVVSVLALVGLVGAAAGQVTFVSPDGNITGQVSVIGGRLTYNVNNGATAVVNASALGVSVNPDDSGSFIDLGDGVSLGTPSTTVINETFDHIGNSSTMTNHCVEYSIPVTHTSSGRQWTLKLRAYDSGVAYRYEVPLAGGESHFSVNGEATEWNLPINASAWYQENIKNYEGGYTHSDVSAIGTGTNIGGPMTIQLADGSYAAITEGGSYGYHGLTFQAQGSGNIVANFPEYQLRGDTETTAKSPGVYLPDDRWYVSGDLNTPWRVTMVSNDLNGLVNNPIVRGVNPAPDPNIDYSFVQPGRALWSWWADSDVTFERQQEYITAAADLGFEYVLVDEGWAHWSDKWNKVDQLVAQDPNVGIWLWMRFADIDEGTDEDLANFGSELWPWGVNRQSVLANLAAHGVVGIKVDFMDSESESAMNFQEGVLADAAAAGLMVNFHGATKPTGFDRQYPNEMTREGIRGLEYAKGGSNPGGEHHTTITFTRMLAGSMDYTPVTFNPSYMGNTSAAHQLATAVTFTSPAQHWVDDPNNLLASNARDIIEAMPAAWDETIVLDNSEIGELAAFARRTGDDWFIGVLNDPVATTEVLDLAFLGAGGWKAVIMSDDTTTNTVMLRDENVLLSQDDDLSVYLRSEGGYVAWLQALLAGDANGDDTVDDADYTIWADNYGSAGDFFDGDFNGDGEIDDADYTIWADNYGASNLTPEPTSLAMLALGAGALIRRRR